MTLNSDARRISSKLIQSNFDLYKDKSYSFMKRISFPSNFYQRSKQLEKSSFDLLKIGKKISNTGNNSLNDTNKRKLIQISKILDEGNKLRQRNNQNKYNKLSITSYKVKPINQICKLKKMLMNVKGKQININPQYSTSKFFIKYNSLRSKNGFRYEVKNLDKKSQFEQKYSNIRVFNSQQLSEIFKKSRKKLKNKRFINIELPCINSLNLKETCKNHLFQAVQNNNMALFDKLNEKDKFTKMKSTCLNKSINFSFFSRCSDENQNKYISKFKKLIMRLK